MSICVFISLLIISILETSVLCLSIEYVAPMGAKFVCRIWPLIVIPGVKLVLVKLVLLMIIVKNVLVGLMKTLIGLSSIDIPLN